MQVWLERDLKSLLLSSMFSRRTWIEKWTLEQCLGPMSSEWWLCENCERSSLLSKLMKINTWFCGRECCFSDSQAFLSARNILYCQNLTALCKDHIGRRTIIFVFLVFLEKTQEKLHVCIYIEEIYMQGIVQDMQWDTKNGLQLSYWN